MYPQTLEDHLVADRAEMHHIHAISLAAAVATAQRKQREHNNAEAQQRRSSPKPPKAKSILASSKSSTGRSRDGAGSSSPNKLQSTTRTKTSTHLLSSDDTSYSNALVSPRVLTSLWSKQTDRKLGMKCLSKEETEAAVAAERKKGAAAMQLAWADTAAAAAAEVLRTPNPAPLPTQPSVYRRKRHTDQQKDAPPQHEEDNDEEDDRPDVCGSQWFQSLFASAMAKQQQQQRSHNASSSSGQPTTVGKDDAAAQRRVSVSPRYLRPTHSAKSRATAVAAQLCAFVDETEREAAKSLSHANQTTPTPPPPTTGALPARLSTASAATLRNDVTDDDDGTDKKPSLREKLIPFQRYQTVSAQQREQSLRQTILRPHTATLRPDDSASHWIYGAVRGCSIAGMPTRLDKQDLANAHERAQFPHKFFPRRVDEEEGGDPTSSARRKGLSSMVVPTPPSVTMSTTSPRFLGDEPLKPKKMGRPMSAVVSPRRDAAPA